MLVRPSHAATIPSGTQVRLAGRVVAVSGQRLLLADALGQVAAVLAELEGLEPLTLVVVEGTWDGEVLDSARVIERYVPLVPRSGPLSEFARLTRDGQRVAKNLETRMRVMRAVRGWFDARAFLEVETPLVVPSPGLDVQLAAFEVRERAGELYLNTSPEYQMKRLLSGGLTHIYQICRCFRDDERGTRHEPEFTMLEWYRAFAGVEAVMRDTEELVAAVATAFHGRAQLLHHGRAIDVTPPWPRLTVREAFGRYAGVSLDEVLPDEERFYRLMIERIEPALETLGPVFLCEYPAAMASLARKKPDDPRVAERFEAYVGGLELCNGFGELTDPIEQRARFVHDQAERRRLCLSVYPIDERFVAALEEGVPPSAGNALGLDRLVMLVTGAGHIEDVLAMPRGWLLSASR